MDVHFDTVVLSSSREFFFNGDVDDHDSFVFVAQLKIFVDVEVHRGRPVNRKNFPDRVLEDWLNNSGIYGWVGGYSCDAFDFFAIEVSADTINVKQN